MKLFKKRLKMVVRIIKNGQLNVKCPNNCDFIFKSLIALAKVISNTYNIPRETVISLLTENICVFPEMVNNKTI